MESVRQSDAEMQHRCRTGTKMGRRGLTLLELIAVMAVIAVLVALLLPAVQSARESARTVQCRSRLRQLAIATHSYESSFGVFPTRNFFSEIQPHLEAKVESLNVAFYGCPSDLRNASGDMTSGRISYAINAGLGASCHDCAGIVSTTSRYTRTAEVTDGLSNTSMIGEVLSSPWYAPQVVDWTQVPADQKRTFLHFQGAPNNADDFAHLCAHQATMPISSWFLSPEYHHLMIPNSRSCIRTNSAGLIVPGDFGVGRMAASVHPGGTHAAFADGAVHFVSSSIDALVWRAQGTRSGREPF